MNFKEFLLKEIDGPAGIAEPAAMPGGGPPMGGGMGGPPLGGGPPMGGGMGGMDPMMGGMGGGMGGMGGGMPQASQPTINVKFLNVWDVLERIVDGKPFKHYQKEEKPSGQPAPQMLQQAQPPNVANNAPQQPNLNIQ